VVLTGFVRLPLVLKNLYPFCENNGYGRIYPNSEKGPFYYFQNARPTITLITYLHILANMFIPLTVNQRRDGLPNILIAGDTAGIFYLLSLLTAFDLNVFLADTGIRKPLRDFPCHRGESGDKANVYYDFFDGRIGAGIVRRMDVALTTSCDLKKWTRGFQVPAIHIWQDASGTWMEFEGRQLDIKLPKKSDKDVVSGLLSGFINSPHGQYKCISSRALASKDGVVSSFPSVEKWDNAHKPMLEESTFSAWDHASDILKKGESINLDESTIDYDEDRRLIELGVPELDILKIETSGQTRYVELTCDLARVFDGLF